MKKCLSVSLLAIFLVFILSGCSTVGEKAVSFSAIYSTAALISLLLLFAYCFFIKKKNNWFVLLFVSVLIVNVGYAFLSLSTTLQMALHANRIAYLGSVFLPLAMLMIIIGVTNTSYKRRLPIFLFSLAIAVFLIAASPGILTIYYKDVSFEVIDGVSTLVKVYGPLHPIYLFYLLGYFAAMVTVIVRASVNKTIEAASHAVILAIAVFVNIGVWFIEQLSDFNFEMLSISYIISELFLLGVHLVISENQKLLELVKMKEEALLAASVPEKVTAETNISDEVLDFFLRGHETLTHTEKIIYDAYLNGTSTKEIMADLNITENTLKFHNKNIYSKLGVSSRKQMLRYADALHQKNHY